MSNIDTAEINSRFKVTALEDDTTVGFALTGSYPSSYPTTYYRVNGGNEWYDIPDFSVYLSKGDYVEFYGDNATISETAAIEGSPITEPGWYDGSFTEITGVHVTTASPGIQGVSPNHGLTIGAENNKLTKMLSFNAPFSTTPGTASNTLCKTYTFGINNFIGENPSSATSTDAKVYIKFGTPPQNATDGTIWKIGGGDIGGQTSPVSGLETIYIWEVDISDTNFAAVAYKNQGASEVMLYDGIPGLPGVDRRAWNNPKVFSLTEDIQTLTILTSKKAD